MSVAAVVVAAGRGSRIGGEIPKQYRALAGKPVIVHATREAPDGAARRTTSCRSSTRTIGRGSRTPFRVSRQRPASSCRRFPVGERARNRSVAVWRPSSTGPPTSCSSTTPPAPSRARRSSSGRSPPAARTVRRSRRRSHGHDQGGGRSRRGRRHAGSRPASRRPDPASVPVRCAPRRASPGGEGRSCRVPDDGALAEWAGLPVTVFEGEPANVKLTLEADFAAAERRLGGSGGNWMMRVGTGFDVHAFTDGDHVWLGGVRIPARAGASSPIPMATSCCTP